MIIYDKKWATVDVWEIDGQLNILWLAATIKFTAGKSLGQVTFNEKQKWQNKTVSSIPKSLLPPNRQCFRRVRITDSPSM